MYHFVAYILQFQEKFPRGGGGAVSIASLRSS